MSHQAQLSEQAIREFQVIYAEEFGEELSAADAQEMALRVLRLFQVVLRPADRAESRNREPHTHPG